MKIFTLLLISITLPLFSAETDQFMSMDFDLKDMKVEVNKVVNDLYKSHLKKLNLNSRYSCQKVALKLGKSFLGLNYNPLKDNLLDHKGLVLYPSGIKSLKKLESYKGSIYEGVSQKHLYFKMVSLDPVVNIKGIYLSLDKFVHFQGSGYVYFKKYLKAVKRGASHQEAMEKAIRWGLSMEKGILGLKGSGVLSFADLEANFQGMVMYMDFCGPKPYIEKNRDGQWVMAREIDISDYLTPNMDEVFNPSYHLPKRWKKYIKKDMAKNCYKLGSKTYIKRKQFYQSFEESYNQSFLASLKTNQKIPTNLDHSLDRVCY